MEHPHPLVGRRAGGGAKETEPINKYTQNMTCTQRMIGRVEQLEEGLGGAQVRGGLVRWTEQAQTTKHSSAGNISFTSRCLSHVPECPQGKR